MGTCSSAVSGCRINGNFRRGKSEKARKISLNGSSGGDCPMTTFTAESESTTIHQECPDFSMDERQLVIRSWSIVENQILQIGLTSYLEMFRRAPESLALFPFLKQLGPEDLEFYAQLKNHSIRLTGFISMLVKQLNQDSAKADDALRDCLLELGRRHFSYGANTSHMELLGRVFVESLQPLFVEEGNAGEVQKSWLSFFRVIIFWLQTGYRFVQFKGQYM